MRVIRYHLIHFSFTLLNFVVVSALMLAFYTLIIYLSSDIHINPGPVSLLNLSLAHLNVHLLLTQGKFDQIFTLLDAYTFDVFALSETWLDLN